jgi:hypothetical protein
MNPEAEQHYSNATEILMNMMLSQTNPPALHSKAIWEFEKAISLGLSHEDEMQARFFLGESYRHLIDRSLPLEEMITTHEFSQAVTQMEKAVIMDAEQGYQYFGVNNRSRLQSLDFYYTMIGKHIAETSGSNEAINFYRQKLKMFIYLPSQPLISVLLDLGFLYQKNGDHESARKCFLAIKNADPIAREGAGDFETEVETRQWAEANLREVESADSNKSKCFIATAAYGSPLASEVIIFRRYRDEVLLNSKIGVTFVKTYYLLSPPLAALIVRIFFLRKIARGLILNPLILLLRRYFHSDK